MRVNTVSEVTALLKSDGKCNIQWQIVKSK